MNGIILKTKHISLRENRALKELGKHSYKTTRELEIVIITYLINNKYLHDIPEECGETLENVLIQNGDTLEGLSKNCIIAQPSKRLETLLGGLQIWGLENDCKYCGCEMELANFGDYKKCTNCGEEISTSFELDPDQYRDDCN